MLSYLRITEYTSFPYKLVPLTPEVIPASVSANAFHWSGVSLVSTHSYTSILAPGNIVFQVLFL